MVALMRRTMAVHLRYKSFYISLPFSAKQCIEHEMTKFCVFWRMQAKMVNVSYFFLKLIAGITNLVSARFRPINVLSEFIELRNSKVKCQSIFH